jgi:hypothetical protein
MMRKQNERGNRILTYTNMRWPTCGRIRVSLGLFGDSRTQGWGKTRFISK